MASDTNQCAIGPDGALLDASQIVWYHDPDDTTPLSAPSGPSASVAGGLSVPSGLHRTSSSNSVASSASSANLNSDDFRASHKPATVIAKVRRTTRRPVPSSRLLDAQNSAFSSTSKRSLGKRKANVDSTDSVNNDTTDNEGEADVDSVSFKKLRLHNQSEGSEAGDGPEEGKSDDDDDPPDLVDVESDDEDDEEDEDAEGDPDVDMDDDDDDDNDGDEQDNAEAIEEAYHRTKGMGDADRSVSGLVLVF